MVFMPIYAKASSTGTPTAVVLSTNISVYQDPWMLPALTFFAVTLTNLIGGRFTTGISFSVSKLSFMNKSMLGNTYLFSPVISMLPRKL